MSRVIGCRNQENITVGAARASFDNGELYVRVFIEAWPFTSQVLLSFSGAKDLADELMKCAEGHHE